MGEPKEGHRWQRHWLTGEWTEVPIVGGRQLLASVRTAMDCDSRAYTKSISNKKPMVPQSLAVHGSKVQEYAKNAPRGVTYERADNGFYAPVASSSAAYKRLLKSRQKFNRDSYD